MSDHILNTFRSAVGSTTDEEHSKVYYTPEEIEEELSKYPADDTTTDVFSLNLTEA